VPWFGLLVPENVFAHMIDLAILHEYALSIRQLCQSGVVFLSSVTLKDVARKAGVSAMTVSASLHGTGRVSAERSEHIRKIARKMGYQPRVAAQMLSRKRTGQVGLLFICSTETSLSDIGESGYTSPVLSSFVQVCEQEKLPYHIEYHLGQSPQEEFLPPRQLTGGLVDGALVVGHPSSAMATWFEKHCSSPLVFVDEPGQYAVRSAVDQGIHQAVMHLAALGHQHIAYMGGPDRYITHEQGYLGFEQACKAFSLKHPTQDWLIHSENMSLHDLAQEYDQVVARWWNRKIKPTAIVVHGVSSARALIGVLLQRGISIPNDVSVIAYGASGDCKRTYPMLSGIEPDFHGILQTALNMLNKLIVGKTVNPTHAAITPNLCIRDTVAAPTR
tara:strand:- start:2960 stop:4123 length:1164 start_codon:yes stop_codon:yes gene_type:complete